MGPVGYLRFGEPRLATVAVDETGNRDGTYYNSESGTTGAVAGDTNSAVRTKGVSGSYIKIPDAKAHSLTRAWDVFNRFVSPGWGTASDGQTWVPQVSTNDSHYSVSGELGLIVPNGSAGTFQMGLPTTTLLYGDMQIRASWSERATGGPLQPASLVAQRVDNYNFVKAELIENSNHTLDLKIVKYVNGTGTTLASASNIGTYANAGDWWYIRFQFEGANYRAKAWKMGTVQPADTNLETSAWDCTGCINGSATSASTGSVAVRSANSASTVRPNVAFNGFWVQTIGLSISMFVKLAHAQAPNMSDNHGAVQIFGKGYPGEHEYLIRYHPPLLDCHEDSDCANIKLGGNNYGHCVTLSGSDCTAPNVCECSTGEFKWYIDHWEGGRSAGQHIKVCNTFITNNPDCDPSTDPTVMRLEQWEQVVVEFDSGDALDTRAGVSLFLNGTLLAVPFNDSQFFPIAMYNNSACCVDAVPGPGGSSTPGVPGTCPFDTNQCESKTDTGCETPVCGIGAPPCPEGQVCGPNGHCTRRCWNIYPMSGHSDLTVGRQWISGEWFNGTFDELAIFPRKLTPEEVSTLYNDSK
jgi:hypothetical protein